MFLLLLLALGACGKTYPPMDIAAAPKAKAGPFILGPGDTVTITVWRDEELTGDQVLDPAGRINLPLVGEVQAGGKTVNELQEHIAERLQEYFVKPKVSVAVQEVGSRRVHVLGFVNTPGTQEFSRDVTLWDALAAAGGFNEDADENEVLLMRREDDRVAVRTVSTRFPTSAEDTATAGAFLWLQPDDVVYVLPSDAYLFEEFANTINAAVAPLLNISQGLILYPDVLNILKDGKRLDSGGGSSSPIVISP
jgi:polysaccharide biosynthesis/export protein